MKTRRGFVVLAAVAAFAVGGTASAGTERGKPGDPAARQGKRCEAFDRVLSNLDARQERLEARIDRVEAKIAEGGLSEKRLAHARKRLERLENRSEKLEAFEDRLRAKFAEKCAAAPAP